MLCPEIWNFKASETTFKIEKEETIKTDCSTVIRNCFYNHLISVVLPDTVRTPDHLSNLLNIDCEYYKVTNLCLAELIKRKFIDSFVKKGTFIGLSINTRIDCDDCVCITPNGLMVLSLTKESYQTFGLDGVVSHFNRIKKSRYKTKDDSRESTYQTYK